VPTTPIPKFAALLKGGRVSVEARVAAWRKPLADLLSGSVVPILHPSPWRLRWLGAFTLVGHPLFWWIWGHWLVQPYENAPLRVAMSASGLALMANPVSRDPSSRLAVTAFTAVFWIQLPVFFSWMYLCNGGNTVWVASVGAMFLIYYHVTDWRAATIGVASGGLLAWLLFLAVGPHGVQVPPEQVPVNTVVIAFCWSAALLLGISSANLRREHLKHTLTTIGIMAHELRTPLATMSLVGDAMRPDPQPGPRSDADEKLGKLSQRLHALVRNMNHQIDSQIANARLNHLQGHRELVSAATVVREIVHNYPYRNQRERECVVVQVRRDFAFRSSRALFGQVIDNLLKNALKALAASSHAADPGDLVIEISVTDRHGHVDVKDRGVGIGPELQARIFEPFFSTDRGTGHGLGLAFCKRVIQAADGTIHVRSTLGQGAEFCIELPLADRPVPNSSLYSQP
jgi:two-component system, CAI-1 autoinducer sensor kinase/phosphatase CqsS